ncbi:MAG: FlgD immunoglobulin-like domain containing protein [Candidatus Eisenbacteria bacterium]
MVPRLRRGRTLGAIGLLVASSALAVDTTPPQVTLLQPSGGALLGGSINSVRWTATDDVHVTRIDLHYKTRTDDHWIPIARYLSNNVSLFSWYVHNTPTDSAWVRVTAYDAAGNTGTDTNDNSFVILPRFGIVSSTLRDFEMPGTPAFGVDDVDAASACTACHAGYDADAEPGHAWMGTMMGHAARDPLFLASLAIADQDIPSSGDFCLRCHTPGGWLAGRCNPTDGKLLVDVDFESVSCTVCHAMIDPNYVEGSSPPEDLLVLEQLRSVPTDHSNGQFVIDPEPRRRGPYPEGSPAHAWLQSSFFWSSDFCGTCHDVSNPLYDRVGPKDYAMGPLDEKAASLHSEDILPLERTYSEWKNSQYAIGDGVFAPLFAGNKPDGFVSTCQDCHMPDVVGKGAIIGQERQDLGFHDMMGGSSWMPVTLAALYPGDLDPAALSDASDRAKSMLERAALLTLEVADLDSMKLATVTVTNQTGHKLPTGFPEGRRMWIHLVARDTGGDIVYQSGAYGIAGNLILDPDIRVYEGKMGISHSLAPTLGMQPGPTFHFALNDTIYKDNRIPPLGFTNAAFETFGGQPVDSDLAQPVPRYPDGQNWDVATYELPTSASEVIATLYYQSVSKEHVEFLELANHTNDAGAFFADVWTDNGRAAPVAMVADTVGGADPAAIDELDSAPTGQLSLFPEVNPSRDVVYLRLDLPRPADTSYGVYDAQGRLVAKQRLGRLSPGPHRIEWNGRGHDGSDAGAGVFWVRVQANGAELVQRIVRVK